MSAIVRSLKILLLGTDYSDRLYTTIFVNLAVALALPLYFGSQAKLVSRRRRNISRFRMAVVMVDKFPRTLKLFRDAWFIPEGV